MTRLDLIRMIAPQLKKYDKPFNRQLFNDTLDIMCKNGEITEKQSRNWIYPKDNWFFEGNNLKL